MPGIPPIFNRAYPACCKLLPGDILQKLVAEADSIELVADILTAWAAKSLLPGYFGELARLELFVHTLKTGSIPVPEFTEELTVNPTLQLFENTWQNLLFYIHDEDGKPEPEKSGERIIVWRQPVTLNIKARPVTDADLLAMKMALEGLSVRDVARQGGVHAALIDTALIRALNEGVVTGPEPLLKREFKGDQYREIDPSFLAARIFTLQWHITQECDLHCRHCYDRNRYKPLSLEQEIGVLDDLADFCASHNVHGQVTFTGGNPLLHPHFNQLYREAANRGFTLAILGNPTSREKLEQLNGIQPLAFYQVSLEGLEEHNDYMRGQGHYLRVLDFLEILRELEIYAMVMLTLTRDNMDQVLGLADILRDKADRFTFNRLSLVGEGANLLTVDVKNYPAFLSDYIEAADKNPAMGIKDNLLNIVYREQERPLFGGCTGFGCGAAFNFIALLADGTVHACRKLPSPLGNIMDHSLAEIFHNEAAGRYRQGAAECRDCPIRPVCGGCLAVSHGQGLDIFRQKDPYCFIDPAEYKQ